MMVMKIVLVAAVVMVLGHAVTGQKCLSRNKKLEYRQLLKTAKCKNPLLMPVQLQVPEGFDSVKPSAIMLPQCTGLSCDIFRKRCLPKQTETHYYTVVAGKGERKECKNVTAQEHLDCECRCEEHPCAGHKTYNSDTCACECKRNDLKKICTDRQATQMDVMWSAKMCACKCDKVQNCTSGQGWDPEDCRCATIN